MDNNDWRKRLSALMPRLETKLSPGEVERNRLPGGTKKKGWIIFGLVFGAFLLAAIAASVFSGARSSALYLANREPGPIVVPYVDPAYNMPVTDGESSGGTTNQPQEPGQQNQNWDRMIIRTATLQLRVKDVGTSMDEIRTIVGGHAGYVTGSESRVEGEYTVGSITLQVPANQFDSIISQLRKLGIKVLNENVTSSDVTEEYTDLNSQLRNLQATEGRILVLMGRAEEIGDILAIDQELREIQGEIERIQGRLNYLGSRAEMSTITVSLYPEAVTVQTASAEVWDPVRIAGEAWEASLAMLANVGTLLITVAVFLWWAVPLALIAAFLLRRTRRTATPAPTPAE